MCCDDKDTLIKFLNCINTFLIICDTTFISLFTFSNLIQKDLFILISCLSGCLIMISFIINAIIVEYKICFCNFVHILLELYIFVLFCIIDENSLLIFFNLLSRIVVILHYPIIAYTIIIIDEDEHDNLFKNVVQFILNIPSCVLIPVIFIIIIKKYDDLFIIIISFILLFLIILRIILGISLNINDISYKYQKTLEILIYIYYMSFTILEIYYCSSFNDNVFLSLFFTSLSVTLFLIIICFIKKCKCDCDCDCSNNYSSGTYSNNIQPVSYNNIEQGTTRTLDWSYTPPSYPQSSTYTCGYVPYSNTPVWGYYNSAGTYTGPGDYH